MLTTQNIDPNDPHHRRFFLWRWLIAIFHWVIPPSQAHMDRESGHVRWIRAVVVIVVCLGVVGTAIFSARPMRESYKLWKAEGIVKEARQYMDRGDIASAILRAQDSARLAPDYEPGIRLNAQLLTMAGYKEAVYFWEKLEKQGASSIDDQKGKIRALLRINREKEARQYLEQLVKDHPTDQEVLKLAEEVWGKQQITGVVTDVLKTYVAAHPEDKDAALRLARLMIRSQTPGDDKVSRDTFWKIGKSEDQQGLDALRALYDTQSLDVAERRILADRLEKHPLADGWDKTKALSLRVSLDPSSKAQLIDAAQPTFSEKKGDELLPYIRWLIQNGEFGRVLNLLDINQIKKRKEDQQLLFNYLTALTMLGRVSDLDQLVNDKEIIMGASSRAFFMVHLGMIKRVDRDSMKRLLATAHVTALNDGQTDMLFLLGSYCTEKLHDFYDIAEECYQDLATRMATIRTERRAFENWIKCARLAGHTDVMAKAANEAVRRWPDDKTFLETSLYANFILGNSIETTLDQAIRLLEANPKDTTRKIVCAFGYYRMGNLDAAIDALQNADLHTVNEGSAVVFGEIVREAGPKRVSNGDDTEFKKQILAILDPIKDSAPLLPEERRMLVSLREFQDSSRR